MKRLTQMRRARWIAVALASIGAAGCGGNAAQSEKPAAPSGPPTIDVVRVVEQPVNVTLSMPGELDPYETVAIYPKVTGFVKTIRVDRGSRVRAGELIAMLEAPEIVSQRAEAQSKMQSAEAVLDTAAITKGTEMAFTVPAYPGQTFSGTVARIAQAVDVKTRTMAIELDVTNTDGRLSPGSFCQVRWPVHRSGLSLFVPSGSVASTTDRTFVIRVRNGKTEWIDVKTGLASGTLTEVFGDLRPGDEIAARGTDEIRSGTTVRVKEQPPAKL